MSDKRGIVAELLGTTPDRRFKAVPALQRLIRAWPNEAISVSEGIESWTLAIGSDLTPVQRGYLEELALLSFIKSALVAQLAASKAVLTEKGELSPLVAGIRGLSEATVRIIDRLKEEIPRKDSEPQPLDAMKLWASALSNGGNPSTQGAPGATESPGMTEGLSGHGRESQ